jgi:hypothetical protein
MFRRAARVLMPLVCGAVLCVTGGLAGEPRSLGPAPELAAAIEAYGLQVVDHVPPGITPVIVSSVSQLERVLGSRNAVCTGVPTESSWDAGVVRAESGMMCRHYHWRAGGFPYAYNLDANVYIQNYGSFTWIDHISSVRFYLSGITLGVYLKDIWTDSAIDPSNHQCAIISGGGTECWYIILKDLITYYERPCWIERYINIGQ